MSLTPVPYGGKPAYPAGTAAPNKTGLTTCYPAVSLRRKSWENLSGEARSDACTSLLLTIVA
ncbi:hypothetical protein [Nostoc sp. T09]|uniref:hypothetical protein n=1 Tax=Nostoc sp. T09 TaxID=1932621 RepID=UPI001180187B|nr:hypothetical protein [Nostoc sp. T09]